MKLNLGSKKTRIKGFLNVDIIEHPEVDIISDVSELKTIKDNSVEEIYASHVLEHFSWRKTNDVLKEWYRVLQPKGRIFISVPNWDFVVRTYLLDHFLSNWLTQHIYGEHDNIFNYHKTIFNFTTLSHELYTVGFSIVKRLETMPYEVKDASKLVYHSTGEQIGLHVEGIK